MCRSEERWEGKGVGVVGLRNEVKRSVLEVSVCGLRCSEGCWRCQSLE